MWGFLFLQLITGLFFITTGYRKVFVAETRAKVFGLFKRYHVPKVAGWAVVLGEFFGGVGLLLPLAIPFLPFAIVPLAWELSGLAALLLLPIMGGALHMSVLPPLRRKWRQEKASVSLRISNFLCTPETQLTVILITTVLVWLL